METKPLVIYHDHCADGFGAAFAAWRHFREGADYMPASYGDKINAPDWIDLVAERDVYILDFSYPKPVMELTIAYAATVVWLDHHKTAFEMWCGKYDRGMKAMQFEYIRSDGANPTPCHIELDDTRSGALIAWNYFHPHDHEVPALIQHIDDYDRWQFKLNDTKAVNKAIWSYAPWTFNQWHVWVNDWELMHGKDMVLEGSAILRAHEQKVDAVLSCCARPVRITPPVIMGADAWTGPWVFGDDSLAGASGLVANCPADLASDVGHHLATRSGTFGLTWNQGHDDRIKCSLRSNGEYDVSKIAAAFGGGGHKNAAGFHTTLQQLQSWIITGQGETE